MSGYTACRERAPPGMRRVLWTVSGRGAGFLTGESKSTVGFEPGLGGSPAEQSHAVVYLSEF